MIQIDENRYFIEYLMKQMNDLSEYLLEITDETDE